MVAILSVFTQDYFIMIDKNCEEFFFVVLFVFAVEGAIRTKVLLKFEKLLTDVNYLVITSMGKNGMECVQILCTFFQTVSK